MQYLVYARIIGKILIRPIIRHSAYNGRGKCCHHLATNGICFTHLSLSILMQLCVTASLQELISL